MGALFRLIFIFFIIIVLFAIIPDKFWNWLKPYFNWDSLKATLLKGWNKFAEFIKDISGFAMRTIDDIIRSWIGVDVAQVWITVKGFLANAFSQTADVFK